MKRIEYPAVIVSALLLYACASIPEGPTILVLKGGGKSFAQFAQDDTACRRFASLEARGTPPDQALKASSLASSSGTGRAWAPAGVEARQHLYDIAYAQCMDDKGHRVPLPMLIPDDPPGAVLLPPPPSPILPDKSP